VGRQGIQLEVDSQLEGSQDIHAVLREQHSGRDGPHLESMCS
jgi:hypothetical protein